MTRFNKTTKEKTVTENYEGAKAYKLTPELELYSLVVTSTLNPKFYEPGSTGNVLPRLMTLMKKVKPEFIAKLAVYTREKMYLRTIPLVLAVKLAKIHKGDNLVSRLIERIIQRADEITETLAYYQKYNKRNNTKKLNKLSKQIQKGIAKAFNKFDEYQFAKYNRGTEVKLRDALFLSHAKPARGKKKLFEKIVNETLEVPYTWETELSEAGQSGKDKKKVWEELIDSKKVGYMAMLRNLRNILQADVSDKHIKQVCAFLFDEEAVLRSKQLPFRFYSAYKEISKEANIKSQQVLQSISKAIDVSCNNFSGFKGKVMVGVDNSQSMQDNISPRSKVTRCDVACVLASMFNKISNENIVSVFADNFKVANVLSTDSVLTNAEKIRNVGVGCGYETNGYKVPEYATKNNIFVDYFVIFTDLQMYDADWVKYHRTPPTEGRSFKEELRLYKEQVNPDVKVISFDVAGYGNTPVSIDSKNVHLIAGWSDKVFDILKAIENGESAIDEIKKIEL